MQNLSLIDGQNLKDFLQSALSSNDADNFIKKLLDDIPLFKKFSTCTINIYSVDSGIDKKEIILEFLETTFNLN